MFSQKFMLSQKFYTHGRLSRPIILHSRYLSNIPQSSSKEVGIKELIQRDIKHAEQVGVIAPAPLDANTFRKIVHTTWELTKFYFYGALAIYKRRQNISAIKTRIRNGGLHLTRAEGRLIELQRKDVNKVIPFVILAILMEELIPVIAIYAPFMLPSTCILPSQQARIEEKKAVKALDASVSYRALFAELNGKAQDGKLPLSALRGNGSAAAMCGVLRLPTFGNDLLRTWRIQQHLKFIKKDDDLLIRDDLLNTLSNEELLQALEERGFITMGIKTTEARNRLKWWLDSVRDHSDDVLARRLSLLAERR
ncbi:hypothetical protein D9758_003638 [Tetrapyrgos nigripes]|uniref:Letm1 RBD domain-containing protein n=1 Tax=Tetrapyrgos nigripes TaxID=182062 RepID=A0A8H5GM14_9AGAR|nr:hypothetical protein D9758_003638 [Tetrapyrgos nigripes]